MNVPARRLMNPFYDQDIDKDIHQWGDRLGSSLHGCLHSGTTWACPCGISIKKLCSQNLAHEVKEVNVARLVFHERRLSRSSLSICRWRQVSIFSVCALRSKTVNVHTILAPGPTDRWRLCWFARRHSKMIVISDAKSQLTDLKIQISTACQ